MRADAANDPVSDLLEATTPEHSAAIASALLRFGSRALHFAAAADIRIVALQGGQRYRDASPAIRRLNVRLDRWPSPPAGLFVVAERTVYLRSVSTMTVAHEFGHALDCALGGGTYRSGVDLRVRRAFEGARSFVTPYAASAIDEYFAEALRAYVAANDPVSPWPQATPERLARIDPPMYDYVKELFSSAF